MSSTEHLHGHNRVHDRIRYLVDTRWYDMDEVTRQVVTVLAEELDALHSTLRAERSAMRDDFRRMRQVLYTFCAGLSIALIGNVLLIRLTAT